jgi:hypothetical protein
VYSSEYVALFVARTTHEAQVAMATSLIGPNGKGLAINDDMIGRVTTQCQND